MIHLSQFQLLGACGRFPTQTVHLYRHIPHGDIHVRVESHGPEGDAEIPCRVDEGCLHRVAPTLLRINPEISEQFDMALATMYPGLRAEVLADFVVWTPGEVCLAA